MKLTLSFSGTETATATKHIHLTALLAVKLIQDTEKKRRKKFSLRETTTRHGKREKNSVRLN
jgi:hypothetical protein